MNPKNSPSLEKYLKILGWLYLVVLCVQGYSALHLLMNLNESVANSPGEVYLRVVLPFVLYPIMAWSLLKEKSFRIVLLHVVAISQIIFFLTLGRDSVDNWAFGFHVLSLLIYWKYIARAKRKELDEASHKHSQ